MKCGAFNDCTRSFAMPVVPDGYTKKFLLIGDHDEGFARTQSPFTTPGGHVLQRTLQQAGIARQDVAFMPVMRCKPQGTAKMAQIRACAPFVFRAVELLKPKYVLALGPNAAKSLANSGSPGSLPRRRGRRLTANGIPAFIYFRTGSIAQFGSSPHELARFKEDLARLQQKVTKVCKQGVPNCEDAFIGFDTEFTPTEVLCGAVSDGRVACTVPAKDIRKLTPLFQKNVMVAHNMTSEIDSMMRLRIPALKGVLEHWLQGHRVRDTLLVAKLVDENRGVGGYKLESLLLSKYNLEDYKHETDQYGPDPSLWPAPLRDERCRIDAWGTVKVFDAFEQDVQGPLQISHEIAMVLHRMRYIGVYIGQKEFAALKQEVYKEEANAKKVLLKLARQHGLDNFQPSKDNDVRELVYGKLGLDVESKTKSGLASASVKHLKEHIDIPEIKALISYSKFDKLKTTYVDGLEQKFMRLNDGRCWVSVLINALAAKTGRRASAGPNFQNLPKRVRQIITSRFKGGVIADNDYSKLEPIIGGWVTGERKLTEYFTETPNGYIQIGKDFFNKEVQKDTKEYTMMKSLVLAILYKKQKWSLAADLWSQKCQLDSDYEKHIEECGKVLDRFLDTLFPGVRAYHEEQESFVLKHGYVDNAVGQRRRLPLPIEPQRSDRVLYKVYMRYKAHVINQAVNYPIQSLASYVTGSAMVDWEREMLRLHHWSYYDFQQAVMAKDWPNMPLLCLEIHDDLVQDIPKGMEKKTKEITHEIMTAVPSLKALLPDFDVKLSVDTQVGPTWGMKK